MAENNTGRAERDDRRKAGGERWGGESGGESANQANDLNLQAQAQIVPDRHTHANKLFQVTRKDTGRTDSHSFTQIKFPFYWIAWLEAFFFLVPIV